MSLRGPAFLLAAAACVWAQPAQQQAIQIVPVKGNIYLLAGAGGNIVISVGPDGVLLVDSGLAASADRVIAAINAFTQEINKRGMPLTAIAPPKPIRYIINTHFHADHTGGNEKVAAAGKTFTGGNVTGDLPTAGEGAAIVAHENVLTRLSAKDSKMPVGAWPTETYYRDQMKLS